ncbi:hypothetical protein JM946_24590 [Steroidobacter sp. S1-65]|uniref:Uncharacterized protein n=1 Tax=Steroidobacter gossypii TaxID=2805490 RepID=A0ABS1X3X4_9GAMM|nr:hypothetical protein [Steroidobacter gossypii]MBM0107925.1 hypothetical protein [Steroidobacter gossypii]
MVILRFLQSFLDIALWRKGPQDLPASTLLATLALIAYMATGFVRMRLFTLDQSTALLFICVDVMMMGAWLWLVLAFFGRRQRFVQTITATLGVGLLVLLLDVTFRSAQLALGWSDELSMNWLMLRFLITALVLGRIFMLALDRGLITGMALTVAIVYSTQAVVQLMLDLRG